MPSKPVLGIITAAMEVYPHHIAEPIVRRAAEALSDEFDVKAPPACFDMASARQAARSAGPTASTTGWCRSRARRHAPPTPRRCTSPFAASSTGRAFPRSRSSANTSSPGRSDAHACLWRFWSRTACRARARETSTASGSRVNAWDNGEMASLGACILAAVARGLFGDRDDAVRRMALSRRTFQPDRADEYAEVMREYEALAHILSGR